MVDEYDYSDSTHTAPTSMTLKRKVNQKRNKARQARRQFMKKRALNRGAAAAKQNQTWVDAVLKIVALFLTTSIKRVPALVYLLPRSGVYESDRALKESQNDQPIAMKPEVQQNREKAGSDDITVHDVTGGQNGMYRMLNMTKGFPDNKRIHGTPYWNSNKNDGKQTTGVKVKQEKSKKTNGKHGLAKRRLRRTYRVL